MPRPPALTPQQVKELEIMVDNDLKPDEIAEQLGANVGTVKNYITDYNKRSKEVEDLQTTMVRRERTPDRLIELIEAIPGIGEAKLGLARMMIKTNPALMQNPQEVYAFCVQALGMTDYPSSFVTKSFFSDLYGSPQHAAAFMFPTTAQPGVSSFPSFAPTSYQTIQTAGGPVTVPAPASQQPLTRGDVERILAEQEKTMFVEETRPVINPQTGQPILGPDGQPILQRTKRPVNQQPDMMQQMMAFMSMFQAMGVIRQPGQMTDMDKLIAAIMQQKSGGADSDVQKMMMDMQLQNAKVMAQLEAQKASNETAQRYSELLWKSEQAAQEMKMKVAVSQAGMSAQDQVGLKVVESGTDAMSKAMANQDRRMDRLERALTPFVRSLANGQQPGVPVPASAQELAGIGGDSILPPAAPDPNQPPRP